jgi:glutamyl-tRNA synthetase
MSAPARTRFAPSPTGYLHVGGVRTALFAWLVARQSGGSFVLRIEDTDKVREVGGAEQHIMDSLHALGLNYDEGPDIGGPFAPYKQSLRLDSYKEWAQKLIEAGRAYADPYSPVEVQEFREAAIRAKKPFLFRKHRPDDPSPWNGTTALRFKSDPKAYDRHDVVMGDLHTGAEVIDDFILIKSDGYPTYNFAHIIDDHEMNITHIIRGQEFLASIPNYLNLYEALQLTPPAMATMPHILGPDGKKKLSKRDGAKDVLDYIREGFLPEALVNFIASLGWNDGTEQELYSMANLIDQFSLDRVQTSAARFDEKRLTWMNGAHIRELHIDDLFGLSTGFWPDEAAGSLETYKKAVLKLAQERLKFLSELPELTRFFFVDLPIDNSLITSHKQLSKLSSEEILSLLETAFTALQDNDFSEENLTDQLNELLIQTAQKPVVLFSLIRIATTQSPASPGLVDTLHLLGKDKSLARIESLIEHISKTNSAK